jgi:type II secretion system protein C
MTLLLVGILAWLTAQLTWTLVGILSPSTDLNPLMLHVTPPQTPLPVLIREASESPLFGQPDTGRPLSQISPTHLALTLLGIAISPQPESSWAIIAEGREQGAPEQVFTTGSTLPSGARIVSIQPLEVILNLGGELQSLVLDSTGETPSPAGPGSAEMPNRSPGLPGLLARRPTALMQYIHPMAVFKNGQFAGYRVFPGLHPRLFMQVGLMPGDIIQQINGETLTGPIQSLNLLRSLGNSQQPIQLTVDQHGQTRIITLPSHALTDSIPH